MALLLVVCVLMISSSRFSNKKENTIAPQNAETARVNFAGDLKIACPAGVRCDQNYDYRAYEYNGERATLYFSFQPSIVGNYSLTNFQNNFSYLNVYLHFPELAQTGETASFYEILRNGSKNIHFSSFLDGKLQGTFEVYVDTITVSRKDPDCMIQDTSPPSWCTRIIPYNKVIQGSFILTLPKD